MSFDAIVQRLQNIAPFNIHKINEDGTTEPWFKITGPLIIKDLIVAEDALAEQLQTVSGRIAYWGRLVAQTKRVWDIKSREYRVWRSTMYLMYRNDGEKHTEKELDSLIRTQPAYPILYAAVETAEEAYNATLAILNGWKSKQKVMESTVFRRNTEDGPVLSI